MNKDSGALREHDSQRGHEKKRTTHGVYALRILESLIRISSVNPYDGTGSAEAEISEFIASTLRSYGLKPLLQPVRGRRRNVIATLRDWRR